MSIGKFKDKFFYLSNFYIANVEYEGLIYNCNEAAFQAAKLLDNEKRKEFCKLNPSYAKFKGRRVKLRSDWEYVKERIMKEIVRNKFIGNEYLKIRLLDTGDKELVEGNWWHDNYYGQCYCDRCKSIIGQNKLGKILMEVRDELRETM